MKRNETRKACGLLSPLPYVLVIVIFLIQCVGFGTHVWLVLRSQEPCADGVVPAAVVLMESGSPFADESASVASPVTSPTKGRKRKEQVDAPTRASNRFVQWTDDEVDQMVLDEKRTEQKMQQLEAAKVAKVCALPARVTTCATPAPATAGQVVDRQICVVCEAVQRKDECAKLRGMRRSCTMPTRSNRNTRHRIPASSAAKLTCLQRTSARR